MKKRDSAAQNAQDRIDTLGIPELREYANLRLQTIKRIEGEYKYVTAEYWHFGRAILRLAEKENKTPHSLGYDPDYVTRAIAIAHPKAFPNVEECAEMRITDAVDEARRRNPQRASPRKKKQPAKSFVKVTKLGPDGEPEAEGPAGRIGDGATLQELLEMRAKVLFEVAESERKITLALAGYTAESAEKVFMTVGSTLIETMGWDKFCELVGYLKNDFGPVDEGPACAE